MSSSVIHLLSTPIERLALALLYALSIATLWLAPMMSARERKQRTHMLQWVLALLFLTSVVDLLMRTAALADVNLAHAWGFIPRVLSHSDYGYYWQWRLATLALILITTAWISQKGWSRLPSTIIFCAALTTTFLLSATSHAGDDGLWSMINIINWTHLVSTSLWGGTVILYALLILPALCQGEHVDERIVVALRLSTLATLALALVLLTGAYNSWHQLGALENLWSSDYGRALLLKLALVFIMMMIGAINRFRWVPALVESVKKEGNHWQASMNHFLLVLRIDSMIFIAISIAAVLLGMESPPAHQ